MNRPTFSETQRFLHNPVAFCSLIAFALGMGFTTWSLSTRGETGWIPFLPVLLGFAAVAPWFPARAASR